MRQGENLAIQLPNIKLSRELSRRDLCWALSRQAFARFRGLRFGFLQEAPLDYLSLSSQFLTLLTCKKVSGCQL